MRIILLALVVVLFLISIAGTTMWIRSYQIADGFHYLTEQTYYSFARHFYVESNRGRVGFQVSETTLEPPTKIPLPQPQPKVLEHKSIPAYVSPLQSGRNRTVTPIWNPRQLKNANTHYLITDRYLLFLPYWLVLFFWIVPLYFVFITYRRWRVRKRLNTAPINLDNPPVKVKRVKTNALAAVFFVFAVLVSVLWIRSYWIEDWISRDGGQNYYSVYENSFLYSSKGRINFFSESSDVDSLGDRILMPHLTETKYRYYTSSVTDHGVPSMGSWNYNKTERVNVPQLERGYTNKLYKEWGFQLAHWMIVILFGTWPILRFCRFKLRQKAQNVVMESDK